MTLKGNCFPGIFIFFNLLSTIFKLVIGKGSRHGGTASGLGRKIKKRQKYLITKYKIDNEQNNILSKFYKFNNNYII